jgi:hypothetical protein
MTSDYTVLVLVDPPVTECLRRSNGAVRDLSNRPYQYGYVDFTPWVDAHEAALTQQPVPSRKCIYDDIYFYLTHSVPEDLAPTPDIPALVVQKLMLSNTIALIEFLKAIISRLEERIVKSKDIKHYAWLSNTMSELFAWNRRIAEYCEQAEAVLNDLNITTTVERQWMDGSDCWRECHNDFHYVHQRMQNLKKRIFELITSANGLIGLVEAQKSAEAAIASHIATKASTEATKASLHEAKAVRTLTIIGVLFLPLSFTSGLLSLGQDFGPGQPRFWIYWAIALPLVCVGFAGLYLSGEFSDFGPSNRRKSIERRHDED